MDRIKENVEYPLFMGVDVGTTNVRSILFDMSGRVIVDSFRGVRILRPEPGAAEEEPEDLWRATLETMKESLKKSGFKAEDVAAIGFSAQMHGVMMLSREGKPLTRLLTWLDLRAAEQSDELSRIIGSYELYRRTGGPPLFIYPLAKILWFKENMPKKFEECDKMLSAKDYVMYRMFGEPMIDRSVASGSQLLNINRLEWDDEALKAVGIGEERLPRLMDELEVAGDLPNNVAEQTGLRKGTSIIIGASDAALSNIGLGAVEEGVAAVNLGSSGAIRVLSDKPILDRSEKARFFCYYATEKRWLPGGAINNAGIILRWFRNTFGMEEVKEAEKLGVDPYDLLTQKAAEVKPGSEGLVMVPFMAGERFPVRDPKARGVIFGLTLSHGKPHFIRAIMESVIYTLRWIMEIMKDQGVQIQQVRIGGGGARSPLWRQITADILGKKVAHTRVEEASALGAALLAAVKGGFYSSLQEASRKMVNVISIHYPDMNNHEGYSSLFRLYKDLYSSLGRLYKSLGQIERKRERS